LQSPANDLTGDAMQVSISDLKERPEFFQIVATRVWEFSWKAKGVALESVSKGLRELIAHETFPFAIVAHVDDRYVGSTLGIVSDMDERPGYTPWVAAVWVETQYRKQNVATSLISFASDRLLRQFQQVYLCARPELHGFYARQGWEPIERDVGEKRLTVFVKP
jgi:GNAT superfamily N-acetyltransferase